MEPTLLELLQKAVKSFEQHGDLRDINQDEAWAIEHAFMVHAYEERLKVETPIFKYSEVFDGKPLCTAVETMGDVNYTERY